jgi:sphingomyelin phosphodiesterase
MTPTSGHPAFRVYSIDPVTYGVLDVETYIANLSNPAYQTTGPVWTKYYSAKAEYGPLVNPPLTDPSAELTPAFWHNVTTVFETNNNAWQDYQTRKSRGYFPTSCTGTCQTQEICAIRGGEGQYNCAAITPGIHFRKRDEVVERSEGGALEVGECEGSILRPILAKLAAKDGLLEEAVLNARAMYRKE